MIHEDAYVFLADAWRYGPDAVVFTYAGYGQLLPRLIAAVGAWLPLSWFVPFAVTADLAVIALLATFTYSVARHRVTAGWAAGMALVPSLTPAMWLGLGSIAYLQWLLLPTAFWALTAQRGKGRVVVCAVAALSSPLAILLLPAAWVGGKRWWRAPTVAALVIGTLAQCLMILFAPRSESAVDRYGGLPVGETIHGLFYAVLGSATLQPPGELLGFLMAAATTVSLTFSRGRALPVVMIGTGLALFAVTTAIKGLPLFRYEAGAGAFVLSGSLYSAARIPQTTLRACVAAVCVATLVLGFPARRSRIGTGDPWSEQVGQIAAQCATGAPNGTLSDGTGVGFWGARPFPCYHGAPVPAREFSQEP